ncbi:MAG: 4-(cytidine 5'-diphospho)-2-C-methyl-D-erythritol kinase [Trueperaceae bacterium]
MSAAPRRVRERAPAKLNLGLRIVGRRPDGFHELDSIFAHLDLADELDAALAPEGTVDRLDRRPVGDAWLDDRALPLGPENLVARAFASVRAALAGELPAVHAVLGKRVPWGAGLGGGSADAAAALRAAARLAAAPFDAAPLAEALGSDVPFCLTRVPIARVGGRGEVVAPLALPPRTVVLVHPGVPVAAADAYRWWAAAPVDVAPMDEAIDAWRDGGFGPLANALQPGVAARVPEVAAALAELRAHATGPVAMSGSGSTCFAVVADRAAGAALAGAVAARRPDWWVRVAVAAAADEAGVAG